MLLCISICIHMGHLLVIRSPNCYTICCRNCIYERGSIILVSKNTWNKLNSCLSTISYFDTDYGRDDDGFHCFNFDPYEYVSRCEIICENPDEELLSFITKIKDDKIIENLMDTLSFYENKNFILEGFNKLQK
jgi:hypothetical protein